VSKGRKIMPTNVGNRLKMPEAGYERWHPHTFFEGLNPDGSARTREGFKNTLTDQEVIPPEGWNADLARLDHGDLACVSHSGDKFRENYDKIQWDKPCSESESPQSGS
jgi:hypothetical protein